MHAFELECLVDFYVSHQWVVKSWYDWLAEDGDWDTDDLERLVFEMPDTKFFPSGQA